jgi:hypothetical protein
MDYKAFKMHPSCQRMVEINGSFDAHETIERMEQIVVAEMMMHMEYISDEVDEKRREEGAICGGHRACAVGSLWLAHGIRPWLSYDWDSEEGRRVIYGAQLPYVSANERAEIMDRLPQLRIAYDALNQAAMEVLEEYAEEHGYESVSQLATDMGASIGYNGAMEAMFESNLDDERDDYEMSPDDKVRMLRICARAKEIIIGMGATRA